MNSKHAVYEYVLPFCEKHHMLPENGRLLCAVSGGADSMCMLHMLASLAPERGMEIICAHFNHQLRDNESRRDQLFVESCCKKRDIPFFTASGDVRAHARIRKLGIEEAARELRYEFLEKVAFQTGAGRIATAHTAKDNAETMLLNLARGAGLRGLCGIPPVRGKIIRPLLPLSREQIMEYLAENSLSYVEDSTNISDEHNRNLIRHHVIPVLKEINPGFVSNTLSASELLREDEECLDLAARDFIGKHIRQNSLPAEALAALPRPISARVFRHMSGQRLYRAHVDALYALCRSASPSASTDLPGMRVFREYDRVVFGDAKRAAIPNQMIKPGAKIHIPGTNKIVKCEAIDKCVDIHNSLNTFFFKSDSICGNITLSAKFDGAKIRLAGRNCTKSLKKLFMEAKIPKDHRDSVAVLKDDKGVIAVSGFGIAERCLPNAGDHVIKVVIEERE